MSVYVASKRITREIMPAEREPTITLTLEAYQQYDAVMPPGAWQVYADAIRVTLADPASGRMIVAVQDGVLVGSVLLVPPTTEPAPGRAAQPYPEIRLVAVVPAVRRCGIAVALVDACMEQASTEGYDQVGLHSTKYMEDAIRIYQRIGFARAPEHDFQTPAGVLVMGFRLALTPALHLTPPLAGS